jgi:hypothetical protein
MKVNFYDVMITKKPFVTILDTGKIFSKYPPTRRTWVLYAYDFPLSRALGHNNMTPNCHD